ncbi:ABC transporter ATP-binding protein [Ectothiorhodospiraceae bacterium 2226]|nr:ABC transporter ATP-binding protein [Ectothiorhodospiraceae bacterium 2226]
MSSRADHHASPLADVPLLAMQGVCRRYAEGARGRAVLDGVDLILQPGERVALMGRSGSGKSTLLNLASGIDLPDSGTVRVAGRELTALNERARTLFRRHHIGFVFQFFNLVPTLTVRENLRLPLELIGRRAAEAGRSADQWLARVGLAERGDSYPEELSGGEQQRVAVARALVHGPRLVLADEPTGNLDEATAREVLAMLAELPRAVGAGLLMVTHSVEAAAVADRTLHLREGRLHADGTAP